MSKTIDVIIKVLPPVVAIITTILVAIGDMDGASSSTDDDYNQEQPDWGEL